MSTESVEAGGNTALVSQPTAGSHDFDASRSWRLHPQVSVRGEDFGGLLYHYGTRRLTFCKDPRLLALLQGLDQHPTATAAVAAAGIDADRRPPFVAALARLAATDMVVPADEAS